MLRSRKILALLVFCVGCAETSSTERPISWVDAKQPAIRLDVDWRPRPPVLESHESDMASDAALGAAGGALKGAGAGLGLVGEAAGNCSGDGCGLVLGLSILLLPVFAVGGAIFGALAGAGESETMVNYYDLGAIESAGTLFEIAQRELDPPVLLQDQVILQLNRIKGINVKTNAKPTPEKRNDISVNVTVLRYNLIGLREENPSVKLVLSGQTLVKETKTDTEFDCFWHYEGPERRLSELVVAEASLFKLDLKNALDEIAEMNVGNLERGRCRDEDLDQVAESPYFLAALPPEELNELQAKLWWKAYLDPSNEGFSTHLKGYTERHKLMLTDNIVVNKAVVQSVDFLHISKERVFAKIAYAYGNIRYTQNTAYGTRLFEIERFGQIAEIVSHGKDAAQRLKSLKGSVEVRAEPSGPSRVGTGKTAPEGGGAESSRAAIPLKTREEIELYLQTHEEDIAKQIFTYLDENGMIYPAGSHPTKAVGTVKLEKTKIVQLSGNDVVIDAEYSIPQSFQNAYGEQIFVLRWISGDLVLLGRTQDQISAQTYE